MEGPVAQQKYLIGITFPAMKDQVIAVLQRNGAPSESIEIIKGNPMNRYVSVAAVSQVWWNAVPKPTASRFNWGGKGIRGDDKQYSARPGG
jgi:hypothetical protein